MGTDHIKLSNNIKLQSLRLSFDLNKACSKSHKLLVLSKSNWSIALLTRATLSKNKNFFSTFLDAKISKNACPIWPNVSTTPCTTLIKTRSDFTNNFVLIVKQIKKPSRKYNWTSELPKDKIIGPGKIDRETEIIAMTIVEDLPRDKTEVEAVIESMKKWRTKRLRKLNKSEGAKERKTTSTHYRIVRNAKTSSRGTTWGFKYRIK